jgi:hypothetical protein
VSTISGRPPLTSERKNLIYGLQCILVRSRARGASGISLAWIPHPVGRILHCVSSDSQSPTSTTKTIQQKTRTSKHRVSNIEVLNQNSSLILYGVHHMRKGRACMQTLHGMQTSDIGRRLVMFITCTAIRWTPTDESIRQILSVGQVPINQFYRKNQI